MSRSKRIAVIIVTPQGTVYEQFSLKQERRRLSMFNNLSLHKKNTIRQVRKIWRNELADVCD